MSAPADKTPRNTTHPHPPPPTTARVLFIVLTRHAPAHGPPQPTPPPSTQLLIQPPAPLTLCTLARIGCALDGAKPICFECRAGTDLNASLTFRARHSTLYATELGNLVSLKSGFVVYKNSFTGSIPTELGRITEVNLFYLFSNDLCGDVPKGTGR